MGGVKERQTPKKVDSNVLFSIRFPDFVLLRVSLKVGNFRLVPWVFILGILENGRKWHILSIFSDRVT